MSVDTTILRENSVTYVVGPRGGIPAGGLDSATSDHFQDSIGPGELRCRVRSLGVCVCLQNRGVVKLRGYYSGPHLSSRRCELLLTGGWTA